MSTVCYDINLDKGNPLAQSDARLLNITWAQYSSEWNSTLHAHRHAEMFFILSGSGVFQLQHDSCSMWRRTTSSSSTPAYSILS